MRARRIIPIAFLLLIIIAVGLFFGLRGRGEAAPLYGEAFALCPGPDQFGYQCEDAGGISYIDATNDTGLTADEGSTTLDMPFNFNFYGTDYSELVVGSNGTLHFGQNFAADFVILCVDEGPVPYLGEMIAPYWDDLDNRDEGTIETIVIGQEPNRIFVVEWEGVRRYLGSEEDTLTFSVQLHETSNKIVFLYKDVTTLENPNGATAFIGLQSVALNTTLTYSCADDIIADRSGVAFVYPEEPNPDLASTATGFAASFPLGPGELRPVQPKGDVAILTEQLAASGIEALPDLRVRWLSEPPGREATHLLADLTGDGFDELVYLWRGPAAFPELAQLAILTYRPDSAPTVLLHQWLSTRNERFPHMVLFAAGDVTGDGINDLILHDEDTLALMVISRQGDQWQRAISEEPCKGRLALIDNDGDESLEIVRERCPTGGRVSFSWQNGAIVAAE